MYEYYTVEKLDDGLYAIDDTRENSMYLIVGSKKALLIDTCMMEDALLPFLRTLTDKPIELALTHAHIDHLYHAQEFETVYLHAADKAAWRRILCFVTFAGHFLFHVPVRSYPVRRFIPITEDTVLDLGGPVIRVIHAPGHTPGSCIFVDETHRVLFMGDAVGNGGRSAWQWVPGCLSVAAYRDSLERLLEKLEPYTDYAFWGGHRVQALPTKDDPTPHPLCIPLIRDMRTLCEKILRGEVIPVAEKRRFFHTYEYKYGLAGMWVQKRFIR